MTEHEAWVTGATYSHVMLEGAVFARTNESCVVSHVWMSHVVIYVVMCSVTNMCGDM